MRSNLLMAVVIGALVVLLGITTAQWLRLRSRTRQRGLFRRWPVPRIRIEELDPRFRADELGATLDAEVVYLGRGTIRVPGGTSDSEAWILAALARDARHLFEFGTCTGKTAYLWARNQPPEGRVTTLTLHPDQTGSYRAEPGDAAEATSYALAESRFRSFRYSGTPAEPRISQLYGDSKAFDPSPYRDQCDVVFVDGSHAYSYVRSDSDKALDMVRPGGLCLWHDYSPDCPGVFRALNDLARRIPLRHIEGTTLVAYRKPA